MGFCAILGYALKKAFFACDLQKAFKLPFFVGNGLNAFFFGKK
jgi:hypothetical protein